MTVSLAPEPTEDAQANPSTDEVRQKAIDESLDAMMEGHAHDEGQDLSKPRSRDESGRFTKKKEEPKPEGENPEGPDEDYDRAVAAMKRDGLPEAVMSQMSREEAIEYGLKREKVQKDVDSYTEKYNQLKDSKQDDDAKQPASVEPQSSGEGSPITQAVETFSELFGDDVSAPLKGALEHLFQKIEGAVSSLDQVQADVAKDFLSADWPQLKDPVKLNAVIKTMKSVEGDSFRDRMERAAKIEFAGEMFNEAKAALRNTHSTRDNGLPARPTGAPGSSTAMTAAEARDEALDARIAGDIGRAEEIEAKLQVGGYDQ